ncbi:hypothetical protein BBJ29_008337 [Phytophthora kernoviae]|uniref:Peptidase C1A papain C-terminal domain-containing protein n=1 Tax=Phytophthora kernoviae TaxID=325452 RepID=A0A3F2RYL9_9STRA|nr:hypothetical protein BBJ29_008337 [Phytophthora kernoviae]RLN66829.1 hypothetical protein BBP00_00002015 [Phytophthora kernoviae]
MEEDMRQRIHMSRQDVETAQAANPDANFSVMSPFSMLTKDEFSTKVLNSYVKGDKAKAKTTNQMGSGSVKPASSAFDKTANEADLTGADSYSFSNNPAAQSPVAQTTSAPNTPCPTTAPPTTPAPKPTTRAPVVKPVTTQPVANTPAATEKGTSSNGNGVDWASTVCMSPVQSQGQCGSCWAFASVAAVESLQCIKYGWESTNKFSEQQLVGCDTQNWGCSGGAPVYAFEYIQQQGLCSESAYPYAMSEGGSASCSASCSKSKTGITGYEHLDSGDESGLIKALKSHPVVGAVASGNAAWKQYTGGVMSSCETADLDHAVLVVGYDDSVLKVRNSWGKNWGEVGYVRMKRSTSGTGTCGLLTDMSYPKI